MKKRLFALLLPAAAVALLGSGCIRTTSEIKPIHITMDINLRVDRALDDFFNDVDKAPAAPPAPAVPAAPAETTPSANAPAKEGN
jgi:hypothetical protein